MDLDIRRLTSIKTPAAFRERMQELGLDLPIDDSIAKAPDSPLAQPLDISGFAVGNRWCIHPMEGWDANRDGSPSRAYAAAVAAFWSLRGEADLWRRSGGRAAGWAGESESDAGHSVQ